MLTRIPKYDLSLIDDRGSSREENEAATHSGLVSLAQETIVAKTKRRRLHCQVADEEEISLAIWLSTLFTAKRKPLNPRCNWSMIYQLLTNH